MLRGGKRALFAVVQRSKDDKWVLPRGKLKIDENPITGARREVVEETGHRVAVNEFLGAITYRASGRPKVVQFWQMQAEDTASHELMADIVAVEWLPLKAAVRRLSYPLEKLFLRNVGRRAAKPRKGRKTPPRIAVKKPVQKADLKAMKKASKRAAKKRKAKLKGKGKTATKNSARSGIRNALKSGTKSKAKAKSKAGKAARKNAGAQDRKAESPSPTRTRKVHSTKASARRLTAGKHAPTASRPVPAKSGAAPAAKPVSAAERKGILQRMLGRLGG